MSRTRLEEVLECAKETARNMEHGVEMKTVEHCSDTFRGVQFLVGRHPKGLICQRSFVLGRTTFYVGLAEPVGASKAPWGLRI